MSASFFWVSWKPAIGLSNCSRSMEYGDRGLQAVAGRAEGAADDAEARLVQAGQRAAQARARRAAWRSAGRRTPSRISSAVTDARSDSFLWISRRGEPGGVGRDHEAADAVVGPRPHDGDVGDGAVGDPHLGAVEHPVVAVALGRGAHAAGVGAEVGLGQAEAADRLAGRHARQPLLLLLLGAERVDREHRQRALHARPASGCPSRRPRARGRPGRSRRARAGAAVALQVHAQQAERAELLGQLARRDRARSRTSPHVRA